MIKAIFVIEDLVKDFKIFMPNRTSKFKRSLKEIDENIFEVTVEHLKERGRITIFFFAGLKKYSQEEVKNLFQKIPIPVCSKEILIILKKKNLPKNYAFTRYQFDPEIGNIWILKNDATFSSNYAKQVIATFIVGKGSF